MPTLSLSQRSSSKSKQVNVSSRRYEDNTSSPGTLRLWFSTPDSYLLDNLLSPELPAKSLYGRLRDALLSTNPPLYHNKNWTFVLEMLSEGTYGIAAIHPVAWTAMSLFSEWCNVSCAERIEKKTPLRTSLSHRSVISKCPYPMGISQRVSLFERTTHAFCLCSRTLSHILRRCSSRSLRATEIIYWSLRIVVVSAGTSLRSNSPRSASLN